MRVRGFPILGLILVLLRCVPASAAESGAALPPDSIVLTAAKAIAWDEGKTSVVELQGPVKIEVDRARMSADNAVVWMTPDPSGTGETVQIALLGKANLKQEGVLRLDRQLLVSPVRIIGAIRLLAARVDSRDDSSDLYKQAIGLRERKSAASSQPATMPATEPAVTTDQPNTVEPGTIIPIPDLPGPRVPGLPPASAPTQSFTPQPATSAPLPVPAKPSGPPQPRFEVDLTDYKPATTTDGKLAEVLTNGVTFRYIDDKQNLLEFVAHDMVVFTSLKDSKEARQDGTAGFMDHITSAYFEGDVQIYVTAAGGSKNELRMRAERVYYEFATDQALMTDVVFHTVDLQKNIPIFMRADKVRQLSIGEFKVDGAEMSSSAFSTPTYGLYTGHAYVRTEDTGDPRLGERVTYNADNVILNAFGVPVFYFPGMGGTMTARGSAFRTVEAIDSNQFGFGVRTQWGLFESIGLVPPKDVDASYRLDYLSKRGPGFGVDGKYAGGFIDDTTRQPWSVLGDFHAYFIDDHGVDVLGAARADTTPPDKFRGRAYLENQNFLSDDLQLQLRLGYISDSTFMAQYFSDDYQNGLPIDESIYLKRQRGSEVITGLIEAQPNRAISTSEEEQQNSEISRLPEVGYYRVGDSLLADHLTFFSENTGSALKFVRNTQPLSQQGFFPGVQPGIPSYEYTGDPGTTTFRGDAREELDYPINAGPIKLVPYAFARYTGYSHGVIPPRREPQRKTLPANVGVSSDQNRVMVGAGARLSTDFWKVDDTVESDLFDLHRLRHVVEPEINVFTSTQTVDQNRLFIYDQRVDSASDVQAVQLALHQRWETKRGGPGRWRSVDFFTLNLYGNFFANQPSNRFRQPTDFRGWFDYSQPESSIARNSANADAQWRISDSTAVLADASENLDRYKLATASVGIAIQRDQRLSYYVGSRYIAALHSNIATVEANYQLDRKYSLAATESLDLAQSRNVYYTFSLTRSFDNFAASIRVFYDQSTNDKGFTFGFQPFGIGRSVGSNQLTQPRQ